MSIHNAIKNNDFDTLKKLVEKGIDVNLQDTNKYTPLHTAFSMKILDENIIYYLLNNNNINLCIVDNYGDTILHILCYNYSNYDYNSIESKNITIVKKLLDKIVELNINIINTKNKCNNTPLFLASQEFINLNLIVLLLKYGAEFYIKPLVNVVKIINFCILNDKNMVSIFFILKNIKISLFNTIVSDDNDCENISFYPFAMICDYCPSAYDEKQNENMLSIITFLLKEGVNPNIYTNIYHHPLYYACKNNNIKLMDLLIKNNTIIDSIFMERFDQTILSEKYSDDIILLSLKNIQENY